VIVSPGGPPTNKRSLFRRGPEPADPQLDKMVNEHARVLREVDEARPGDPILHKERQKADEWLEQLRASYTLSDDALGGRG
jgi:hypothetical protein